MFTGEDHSNKVGNDSSMSQRESDSIESDTGVIALERDEMVFAAAKSQLLELISSSSLPRTSRWLRHHVEGLASLRIHSALHFLEEKQKLELLHDGTWQIANLNRNWTSQSFDPLMLVGPVWEPKVVTALRDKGLPVEQQKHVLSYYLDVALECANGRKLNVEVDGRTHRMFDGQRRPSDIIRDARLRVEGWIVHRIWVRDLMADFEGRIREVVSLWDSLKGEQ